MLKIIKRLHYDHHVDPDDLKLLFLPLWFSIPGFIIYGFIVFLITGDTKSNGVIRDGLSGLLSLL